MEISNYYVPVTLILPLVAIPGILFVTLATSYVVRRRRREESETAGRDGGDQNPSGKRGRYGIVEEDRPRRTRRTW
jgi:hypothetical protein